jgi:NADH:ubiquinone oxidoreductase subunit 6 (subunit J)
MNPLTTQAVVILVCVGAIAVLTIALILLSGLSADRMEPGRARLLRMARIGAQVLVVASILAIAWMAKNG